MIIIINDNLFLNAVYNVAGTYFDYCKNRLPLPSKTQRSYSNSTRKPLSSLVSWLTCEQNMRISASFIISHTEKSNKMCMTC